MENRQKIAIFCVAGIFLLGIIAFIYCNATKKPVEMELVPQEVQSTIESSSDLSLNLPYEEFTTNYETEDISELQQENFSEIYSNVNESEVVSQ